MAAFLDTGIDQTSDVLTAEEAATFLAWTEKVHGSDHADLVAFARFLVDHDPVGLKRLRRHIATIDAPPAGTGLPVGAAILMWICSYCVLGNEQGTLYEVIAAKELGASRDEVVDVFRLAGFVGGPLALNAAAALTGEYLADWRPSVDDGIEWPGGWRPEPGAFAAGLDPATNELLPGELERIERWHESAEGDVPRQLSIAARLHGPAVKTMRLRFEAAMGSKVLPARLMPLLLVHVEALRCRPVPLRRAAALARHVGCTSQQVLGAILWASVYGGDGVAEPAVTAVSDLLDE